MAEDIKVNTIAMTKTEFDASPLKAQYNSYEEYLAQVLRLPLFEVEKLGKNFNFDYKSAFIDMKIQAHEKHNLESEQMIARYKELEQVYLQMKGEQQALSGKLYRKYGVRTNRDLLAAMRDKNSMLDNGLYTKSAKSTDEAYNNYIAALQMANYQTHRFIG